MGTAMGDRTDRNRNTSASALTYQGFLTEDNCSLLVAIKTEPLTDYYEVETRPFARFVTFHSFNTSVIVFFFINK